MHTSCYPSSGATEEVNPTAVRPAKHIARPQALGERITVALIPTAEIGLRRLQERTNLSKTDLANRAITSYEFLDAQMQARPGPDRQGQKDRGKPARAIPVTPRQDTRHAGPALARRGRRPGTARRSPSSGYPPIWLARRASQHRQALPAVSRPEGQEGRNTNENDLYVHVLRAARCGGFPVRPR